MSEPYRPWEPTPWDEKLWAIMPRMFLLLAFFVIVPTLLALGLLTLVRRLRP